jgi:hypothetical protein
MEWRKVKHSNNGDSCFSLLEKNPFVLLSHTHVPWLLFNSAFLLFLPLILKKKKKDTMNSEENGRHIPVFQLSLGVINSKVKHKVIKRRNIQQKLYQIFLF